MTKSIVPQMIEMKSVVLLSDTPEVTAAFYREVMRLPLETERHRGTERHWACQLGSIHFAIHERKTFWLPSALAGEPPATVVSFTVENLEEMVAHLATHNVQIVARTKIGPMSFVAVRDPDGRHVCCGTRYPGA